MGAIEALAKRAKQIHRMYRATSELLDHSELRSPITRRYRTARQLRPEEVDQLVVDYGAGANVYQLAEQYGISRGIVGKHLRSRGVDTRPPGLYPDDVPTAAGLYRDGWSLQRVAEKFTTTADTVRRRLLEAGVVMRDTHGRPR